jgi:hypothetical protein
MTSFPNPLSHQRSTQRINYDLGHLRSTSTSTTMQHNAFVSKPGTTFIYAAPSMANGTCSCTYLFFSQILPGNQGDALYVLPFPDHPITSVGTEVNNSAVLKASAFNMHHSYLRDSTCMYVKAESYSSLLPAIRVSTYLRN